jgi:tol-pal system protein YbgF
MKIIPKFLILTLIILSTCIAQAQSPTELNAMTIAQLEEIKEQIKQLRGDVEKLQHENTQLNDKLVKMSADIEHRFSQLIQREAETKVVAEAVAIKPTEELSTPSKSDKKTMEQEYQDAYSALKEKSYQNARTLFQKFLENHTKSDLAGSAHYWIGETYFAQENYDKAAAEYLKGYQANPIGSRAPENLLKLARSMAKLNNNKNACVTLMKLKNEFPKIPNTIKKQMNEDIKALKCK